jgi:hypothetical protein
MMKRIFILAGWLLFFTSMLNGQNKNERTLTLAIEQFRKAMIDADIPSLEKLVSDNVSYGHSSGAVDDKKEFLEKLRSGRSDFVTLELTDQTIRISGRAGIVRHKLHAKTNDSGKAGVVNLLVLLVWQREGGGWKLLARQAVKVS